MHAARLGPAAGAIALLAACVSNPAPSGWLPPAEVAATDAFGGWITVDTAAQAQRGWFAGSATRRTEIAGELIAVHADSVFLLADSTLVSLPRAQVRRATLFAYDAQWGGLATWGFLGTLSAISNGLYFLLTGPTWIITSSIAAGSRSRAPMVSLSDQGGWERLRLYARFPQGLPEGLDRASLRPRLKWVSGRRAWR
jgi:hypothetical protein